jgi:hypothetical protein
LWHSPAANKRLLSLLGTSAYASASVRQTTAFDYERQSPSASDPRVPTSATTKAAVLGINSVIALWNGLASVVLGQV